MSSEEKQHKGPSPSKSIDREKEIQEVTPNPLRGSCWTPVTLSAYLAALEAGSSRRGAAAIARISYVTAQNRMKKDPVFSILVQEAEAKAERFALSAVIKSIRMGSWNASAWYLERRFPEEWSANAPMAEEIRREMEELAEKVSTLKSSGKDPIANREMTEEEYAELDRLRAQLREVETQAKDEVKEKCIPMDDTDE